MIRRIALVAGTFAVLLAAYVAYDYASRDPTAGAWRMRAPAETHTGSPAIVPAIGEICPSDAEKKALYYDKDHNLQAVFTWEATTKIGRRVRLRNPRVEWYLRDGQTVVIEAEQGFAEPTDVAGRWDVREGRLEGHVLIIVDRGTAPGRTPLKRRPRDEVRIHLDDAYFNRDRLTIRSEGRVMVFSFQVDLLGDGLLMAWSEAPRVRGRRAELREFRIERGQWMSIRQVRDRFLPRMRLPGGGRRAEAAAGAWRSGVGGLGGRSAWPAGPTGLPAVWLVPVMLAATPPAGGRAATMPMVPPASLPTVPDTYVATFSDNVNVDHADGHLYGADSLQLVFEFERQQLDELRRGTGASPAPERPTSAAPGGSVSTAPAGDAVSTAPAAASRPDGRDSLTVTWDGPLVVRPLRGREEPIHKRFDVAARGRRLELADGESTAECLALDFRSPPERGKLVGTAQRPVRMKMAGGEEISAPLVRFDRESELIHLVGPGRMHRPGRAGNDAVEHPEAEELTITWTGSVEVRLGQKTTATGPQQRRFDYIRQATFLGNVGVRQGSSRTMRAEKLVAGFHEPQGPDESARIKGFSAAGGVQLVDTRSGEFIKARELDVVMSSRQEARIYPRRVVARGEVSAHQEEADVKADELTLAFTPVRDAKTGTVRLRPQRLDATGAVRTTIRGKGGPVHARADRLTAMLAEGTATLLGKPAEVTLKDKALYGRKIFFTDRPRDEASVTGPGRLAFYTDQDISGNRAKEPIPVKITWTKGLEYSGRKRIAVIEGKVNLEMGADVLACETLQVEFAAPREAAGREGSTGQAGRRPRTEEVEFNPRKIAMVRAEKDVLLQSARRDDEGFLLRGLNLWSQRLVYHASARKVVCDRPGRLLVVDYRQPKKTRTEGRQAMPLIGTEDVSGPWQTLFAWRKSMTMREEQEAADFTVTMAGQVMMRHRSGREMVLLGRLNVRPWGKLPEGRNLELTCERMLARFARRQEPASSPTGQSPFGPRVGRLQVFDANRNVRLAESTDRVKIFCHHMLYRRATDIAIIEGAAGRDAVVTRWDRARRMPVTSRGPAFTWNPKSNSFRAAGVEVIGAR